MRRRELLVAAALLLAIVAAYGNHFGNGFHFDDFHTMVDNPSIRSLGNVPRFFGDATTFSVLPANRTYRPMVSASLALDYALGHGYAPFWFHLSTFVLFLGLVGLLFVLYRQVFDRTRSSTGNGWLALGAAAWFGLHPAMAETVNYVIQRGDLFCTLGCVGALALFARYPGRRWMGVYLLPLVFALLSKPPAAVFPVLLFLYIFFFEATGRGDRWRRSALAAAPSAVVTGLLLWVQTAMTPKSFAPSILSPWAYRMTQPYVWLRYFGALILPVHLNVDTDLSPFSTLNVQMAVGLVFVAGLAAAIWWTGRRREWYPVAFGLAWFVVTQVPTSVYALSEVENDHRMFFSFVGLMLALVWAGALAVERVTTVEQRVGMRPAMVGIAAVVLLGYAYGTHRRNAVWRDEETLWLDDVQKSPKNGRGLMIYGLTQMNKGAYSAALGYFERALVLNPDYPTLEINLGVVNGAMADQGDAAKAAVAQEHFLRAISLAPGDDSAHAFYGRWLSDHGRYAEAIGQLQTAVALNGSRVFQHDVLIEAYRRAGDVAGARSAALEVAAIAPDDALARQVAERPPVADAAAWINRSLTLNQMGRYEESIEAAREALRLDPRSAVAWNNIAAGDEAEHRWDAAIEAAQKALELQPELQIAKNNLAWSVAQKRAGAR